jgi:hypothetical protein
MHTDSLSAEQEAIKRRQKEVEEENERERAEAAAAAGMGGMGGGGVPPGMEGLFSDPEIMKAMQNPKVMAVRDPPVVFTHSEIWI